MEPSAFRVANTDSQGTPESACAACSDWWQRTPLQPSSRPLRPATFPTGQTIPAPTSRQTAKPAARFRAGSDRGREAGQKILPPADRARRRWRAKLRLAGHTARKKRSEEHTSELQSQSNLVCRLL